MYLTGRYNGKCSEGMDLAFWEFGETLIWTLKSWLAAVIPFDLTVGYVHG
jgi:hypothetical protein